jgi:ribonuclease BN (tRNA processing enzyme)
MKITVVPLGINGYIPGHGRHTMSILVVYPPKAILLDAGTGVARLLEPAINQMLASCEELHVILSHYHLDHVMGIFFLPEIWKRGPVIVHGPTPPISEFTPEIAIPRLLAPPLSSDFGSTGEKGLVFRSVSGKPFEIGGLKISVHPQKHPGGSMGIRIDDDLVYATDTQADEETAHFAQGCKVLLHDTWMTPEDVLKNREGLQAHTALFDVIRIAKLSGVPSFVPIHLNPWWGPDILERIRTELVNTGISFIWPEEGEILRVD